MNNYEETKNLIEEKYAVIAEKATELNDALNELREINVDFGEEQDALQKAYALGHDIDCRVAYVLRRLLLRHGNVLFL